MKEFSKFEKARMKRTAANVSMYLKKKNKLVSQIEALQKELDEVQQLIDLSDAATKALTGGYGTEDILQLVVEETDKADAKGNPIKVSKWEFKYPDTIIPPAEEITQETETIEPCHYAIEGD